jgi:hypothetical protein
MSSTTTSKYDKLFLLNTTSSTSNFTGDSTAFDSLSDHRLKTEIKNIDTEMSLAVIAQLRPVAFKWKADIFFNEDHRNKADLGFIAQEVADLIPEAVDEYRADLDTDIQYKYLKYERIIPHLVGAIQELNNEIRRLQYTVERLSERIER